MVLLLLFSVFTITSCRVKTQRQSDFTGHYQEEFKVNRKTGLKEGLFRKYLGDILVEEAQYADGKLSGERKLYYHSGEIEIIECYVNGVFQGPYKGFHENGHLKIAGNYSNGVMDGPWIRYYNTGKIMEIVNFSDNNENGPFIEYYQNGQIKANGNYLNGDYEHGLLLLYNENGELEKKMMCDQGFCRTVWDNEQKEN